VGDAGLAHFKGIPLTRVLHFSGIRMEG